MKKLIRKLGLSLAAVACFACASVGVALGFDGSLSVANAATAISESDFYVNAAGVRLINDANGAGIRFHTRITDAEYAKLTGNYETGTLIIPEIRYDGELTLDDAADTVAAKNRASKIVTTDIWWDNTEVEGWMQSTVYLHDVPEMAYGARYIARSYITYEDGTTVYSSVSPATSLTDISLKVQASSSYEEAIKTQVAPYIVEEVKVTYAMPDGSKQTKTVEYGSKLSAPEYDTDAYVLESATDQYGNAINFADYEATLPVTIDVELAKTKTVVTQWIRDQYGASAVQRAFVNGSTATAVTEGIPNGYSSVLKLDWFSGSTAMWDLDNGNRDLYRACFDNTDLSIYDKVTFAMMLETNSDAYIATKNGGTDLGANVWLYFELVQTSANVWTVTVTNTAGEILYTTEGLVRNSNGFGNDVDSIGTLLFCAYSTTADAPKLVVRCPSSTTDTTASIYFTEVIGYVNTFDFDPQISEDAEILWNHVWNNYYFTGGAGAEGAYAEDVTAPKGFNYVNYYSWTSSTSNDFPVTGHLNDSDISAYSDLWFAMKVENGMDIYVQGAALYTGGDWLYVHMYQTDDTTTTWTKEFYSADGYSATQTGLTDTLFDDLMQYKSGTNRGSYPRHVSGSGVTTTAYFTDVLAIKKDGTAITPPKAPDYATGSFEVDISADAIPVRSYVWRDDKYALSASTTETAPEGYNNIVEFSYLHNPKSWSTTQTNFPSNALDDTLDISKYSDLYFATKMTGSTKGHYIHGTGKFVLTDDWVYVHYTQDASAGTWSMSLSSPDTTAANVGENVKTGVSATDLNALILATFYPTRTSATEDVYVYYTEVFGVPASQPTTDRVIYSAVDGAILTDAVGIPTGFTSAFKYENFSADKFAAMDLTDTIYQEISFGMLANTTSVMLTDKYNDFEGYEPSDYANFRTTTSSSGVMYLINLVNNGSGSWTVTVNTKVHFDPKAAADGSNLPTQSQPSYTATVSGNSLKEIMSTFMQITDKVTTVYVTEVRGTHTCAYNITKSLGNGYLQDYCVCGKTDGNKYEFAHGIPEEATEVRYSPWRDDKFALSASTEEAIPAGFNSIVEFDWLNGANGYYKNTTEFPIFILDGGNAVSGTDISKYSDLYFAIKYVGSTAGIYIRGQGAKYNGGDWLYVHYSQADDGTWSLSLSSPDGYVKENVQTGIDAEAYAMRTKGEITIAYPTLAGLMQYGEYGSKNNGFYPTRSSATEASKVYFTNVLGIIACDHEGYERNYVSNNDGTHNEVCTNCNTVLNANIACAGGTATCTEAAVCSTCNTAYGTALGHGDTTWNWGVETCNVCGETVGTAEIAASSAIIDSTNAHLTLSNNAAGVTAPAGFSNVTNLFSASGNTWNSGNRILGSNDYAQTDLGAYDEVWFAIAVTGGHFTNTADSWKDLDSDSQLVWIKFHMVQTATDVWTVSIYVGDTLYKTFANRPGDTIYELTENNNNGLRLVIYQQNANSVSTADTNIYATEVLGVFNTGIPTYATNVWDHIWNADGVGTDVDVAVPEGFTSVNKVTWSGTNANNYWPSGKVNASTEISNYSDLWFAMKVENTDIWCEGIGNYTGGGWLYFHLHQNSDGSWSKAFRSADGWYNDSKQQNLSYTNLKNLLEYLGGGVYYRGSYPNWVGPNVTGVVYSTNVVGVLKCDGVNHTATTYVSNGDGTHSVSCHCGTVISASVNCAGGVDTCKSGAICSDCGYVYGTAGAHTGGENTCTQGAICDVCGTEYGTALGHSGAWNETVENQYECARCGKYVGAVTTSLTEQTDVALFTNATYAALGASATGAFDATVVTPANIDLSGFVSGLEISNVANVELNGTPYVVSSFADNVLTIQVIPYDVYGEYMLTATITVAGKTFDVEMPILVITDLITTNNGLLNVRKVLRGPDSATYTATATYNSTEFRQFGGQGGTGTMDGNGYYKLGADITMSEIIIGEKHTDDYTQQLTYVFGTPTVPFAGTFDGAGYILNNYKSVKSAYNMIENRTKAVALVQDVSNISATSAGTTYENEPSLFGHMNGLVKNLAITNAQFGQYGNIVLSGTGAMENVYLDVANLQAPRYGDTAVENLSAIVAPLLQRSNGTNVILRNVVVDLRDAVFSGQTDDKIATHYPALIGPGLRTAENVAVYGFNTAWINSDGTRGNVYTGGSDGSAAGIYVKYADNTTNGASFWTSGLDSRIWKLVNDIPYLLRVNVSGTASEPSVPPTQSDNDNIVDNGTTEYYIGWNNADVFEQAYFIKDIMQQSSGATISVGDVDLTDFNKKQIVIGTYYEYAKYVFESGTGYTNDLATDGRANYGVYLVDRTFFVLADSDEGFEYAAQKLCRAVFGYNEIWIDEETYPDHTTALITLANVDADYLGTSQIAFNLRNAAYSSKAEEKNELGFTTMPHYTTYVEMHNSLDYFDGYTDANVIAIDSEGEQVDQVCYLARGNQTSFTNMINHVVGIIEAEKAENPNMTAINFMLEDNKNYCACTSCAKFTYASVPQQIFLNEVARKLAADGCDVDVAFFSYNAYSLAPILENGDANEIASLATTLGFSFDAAEDVATVTYDDSVDYDFSSSPYAATSVLKAADGLRLWWTSHEANHSFALEHVANAHMYLALQAWIASIGAENVDVFMYQVAYRDYFMPLNTWEYQVLWYQSLNRLGVNSEMFNLGNIYNSASAQTGFAVFKTYIDSRAMRDSSVTFEQLKDEFFGVNGYYGPAGPTMRNFFEELVEVYEGHKQGGANQFVATTAFTDQVNTLGTTGSGYIAGWYLDYYGSSNPNYYQYARQAFCNGTYSWNITSLVFGDLQSSTTPTPVTNMYEHSKYDSQAATLIAWYNYCQKALAEVSGNATYEKRIKLEAIFPEYAYLVYNSTYKTGLYYFWNNYTGRVTSTQPTIDRATFVDIDASATNWYQDFYTRVVGLGVTRPSEFYPFIETTTDTSDYSMVYDGMVPYYMYESFWKNWGITAS